MGEDPGGAEGRQNAGKVVLGKVGEAERLGRGELAEVGEVDDEGPLEGRGDDRVVPLRSRLSALMAEIATTKKARTKRTRPIAGSTPFSRPPTSESMPHAIRVAILPLGSSNSSAQSSTQFLRSSRT